MTPGEINAAIARTVMNQKDICGCGLHWIQSNGKSCGNPVSNYHNSLDAIVPVVRESALKKHEYEFNDIDIMYLCFAPPDAWCEFYLRKKGLWK